MASEENSETANRLEEYGRLQAEILAYSQQRTAILATTIGASGVFLAFGAEHALVPAILGLYAVLIGGALLTWNGLYQATRRAAYIQVFLEPHLPGLKWYSLMRVEGKRGLGIRIGSMGFKVRPAWIPHEYPIIYLMLGAIGLLYVFSRVNIESSEILRTTAVAGTAMLVLLSLGLQIVNTAFGFNALAAHWEKMAAYGKEGD